MTTYTIIIGILVVLLLVFVYIIRNLLVKLERIEDLVLDYEKYFNQITETLTDGQKHLKNLDERGVFQSDDEVGYFFRELKQVQEQLNQYITAKTNATKEIK